MTFHASKIESLIISISHMSLLLKNIGTFPCKNFMAKFFFDIWEGVKVGNGEIFLTPTYFGRFQISFFV